MLSATVLSIVELFVAPVVSVDEPLVSDFPLQEIIPVIHKQEAISRSLLDFMLQGFGLTIVLILKGKELLP